MAGWVWAVIVVAVVVVCAIAIWSYTAKRKTQRLQQRFGPEYDRVTEQAGKRDAEKALAEREERHDKLNIRPLPADSRAQYAMKWKDVQSEFVDAPATAVAHADGLVSAVMNDRGYPMDDFDQRAADVSVDHPEVVENYRKAHRIFVSMEHGAVSTEEERKAMQHYRRLFDDLLGGSGNGDDGETAGASARSSERAATSDRT
jgi:hypothetical protein